MKLDFESTAGVKKVLERFPLIHGKWIINGDYTAALPSKNETFFN